MKEQINYGASQQQHKLRFQDQLFHAVALNTDAVVTYKSVRTPQGRIINNPADKQGADSLVDAQFTSQELTHLKRFAIDARRRNYIEAGAQPHEVSEIITYGQVMDQPMTAGHALMVPKKQ